MRMPNGDLQIDFRDPDVADTVGFFQVLGPHLSCLLTVF